MPDVRNLSLSLMRHQIFHDTLRIPHRLVHLCLDISESLFMGIVDDELAGFRTLGQGLAATAATLQILKLGMAHLQMMDSTFVYFCSVGLSPLTQLCRLSLDTSSNQLTNVGVEALQHALSPTTMHFGIDGQTYRSYDQMQPNRVKGPWFGYNNWENVCQYTAFILFVC